MPRFSIIAAMASALRWMFSRSLRDVRDREQRDELVDDGALVLLPPCAQPARRVRLREGRCRQNEKKRQEVSCHWSDADLEDVGGGDRPPSAVEPCRDVFLRHHYQVRLSELLLRWSPITK